MISLLPFPKSVRFLDGESFLRLPPQARVLFQAQESTFAFLDMATRLTGLPFTSGYNGVVVKESRNVPSGGYRVTVDRFATVFYSDMAGLWAGFSALLQLMEANDGEVILPRVDIQDAPDRDYRGLMVDLARKWHPVEILFRYVDVCALLRINRLHLHFNDDQSYTLPSDRYPELSTPGRCYTKRQLQELDAYAAARGVVLVPELEIPGHAKAMVSALPELFGWKDGAANVLCVGKPEVRQAVKELLDEMCQLFPHAPIVHVGGDEAKLELWNDSQECVEYMESHGLADVKDLYCEFVGEICRYVQSLGRQVAVWEGFPPEGRRFIPENVLVEPFESLYYTPDRLFSDGYSMINVSWQPLYCVPGRHWTGKDILAWNLFRWENWWDRSAAFETPIQLPTTDRVGGAQYCFWETAPEDEAPWICENLAAVCERCWNVEGMPSYESFSSVWAKVGPRAARLLAD